MNTIQVQCCVVGGGPAGMMLGYLMARAGVETVVLEKHKDFLRDFRGDTVHPSTTQIMQDLGLLEEFLTLPHQKVSKMQAVFGDDKVTIADFSTLNTPCPYVAFMPQWDFWSSEQMDVTQPFAKAPVWPSKMSIRPSMFSGFVSGVRRVEWKAWPCTPRPVTSSSPSIAATTSNAPMCCPKAAPSRCGRAAWTHFAPM
jgi:hypothetical protein